MSDKKIELAEDSQSNGEGEWTAVATSSKRRLAPQSTLSRGDFAAKEKAAKDAEEEKKKGT